MTRAGTLRHVITIEEKTATRSATGAEVITWSTFAKVRAEIIPLRGREFMEARRLQDASMSKIRIRYRTGVIPEMRITWGDHTYDIISVVSVGERRRDLEIMVSEIT